ncbi:hypothetical protein GMRT_14077 [Giardia muris]|uniref:DinF protein n=1 Tax=Giardia muris TaxID=5742 RepID=A0A4Z1T5G6_GIAMU|nr:hypothetical protein GMRT_14077 [Giardia muris]|eukprot:TNJ29283.1 hypothetical protein GMRT_14077 [Giardia muris]
MYGLLLGPLLLFAQLGRIITRVAREHVGDLPIITFTPSGAYRVLVYRLIDGLGAYRRPALLAVCLGLDGIVGTILGTLYKRFTRRIAQTFNRALRDSDKYPFRSGFYALVIACFCTSALAIPCLIVYESTVAELALSFLFVYYLATLRFLMASLLGVVLLGFSPSYLPLVVASYLLCIAWILTPGRPSTHKRRRPIHLILGRCVNFLLVQVGAYGLLVMTHVLFLKRRSSLDLFLDIFGFAQTSLKGLEVGTQGLDPQIHIHGPPTSTSCPAALSKLDRLLGDKVFTSTRLPSIWDLYGYIATAIQGKAKLPELDASTSILIWLCTATPIAAAIGIVRMRRVLMEHKGDSIYPVLLFLYMEIRFILLVPGYGGALAPCVLAIGVAGMYVCFTLVQTTTIKSTYTRIGKRSTTGMHFKGESIPKARVPREQCILTEFIPSEIVSTPRVGSSPEVPLPSVTSLERLEVDEWNLLRERLQAHPFNNLYRTNRVVACRRVLRTLTSEERKRSLRAQAENSREAITFGDEHLQAESPLATHFSHARAFIGDAWAQISDIVDVSWSNVSLLLPTLLSVLVGTLNLTASLRLTGLLRLLGAILNAVGMLGFSICFTGSTRPRGLSQIFVLLDALAAFSPDLAPLVSSATVCATHVCSLMLLTALGSEPL